MHTIDTLITITSSNKYNVLYWKSDDKLFYLANIKGLKWLRIGT